MAYELAEQKQYFRSGATRTLKFRIQQLRSLANAIERMETELFKALRADLGKPTIEAYTAEIGYVMRDIDHARRNLSRWMRSKRVHTPFAAMPARSRVAPEPLGVVLILGPWNYPFQLLISPLVNAIAAGNCALLKPSEHAPATAEAVANLCAVAFPANLASAVQGDGSVARKLSEMPFDHIFFTGSTAIGRKVAEAAARNLVPVTLELGGKSPCVVCEDADLNVAARRIMWGKFMNAGQTCVAPDYLLVHTGVRDRLIELLADTAAEFLNGGEYGRIVNRRHFDRLVGLMEGTDVFAGGESDAETLTIKPAILTGIDRRSPVMQEEIFGPLLPILTYTDFEAEIGIIAGEPSPLAAYIFTADRAKMDYFERVVRAGSICVNDTISQLFPADLPFGGVGASGYGRYHGRAGFDTFSNMKSVMVRSTFFDPATRYPPYKIGVDRMKKFYRLLMR